MPLHVPTPAAGATAADVWAYATKLLTNPAAAQDLLNMQVGISPTATGRAALIDEITAARLSELDPANLPGDVALLLAMLTVTGGDVAVLLSRLSAARALLLDNLNNPQLLDLPDLSTLTATRIAYLNYINNPEILNLPNVKIMEHEIEFPSQEALNDIALTGAQTTTECTITVSLPTGATIRRVLLLAVITAMNNTSTEQKMDVTVQGRKGAGGWSNFFSQTDCIGFGAVDGATTSLVALQDVTALVDVATGYGFRLTVNQSAANSVRYTTQYLLVVTYRMS